MRVLLLSPGEPTFRIDVDVVLLDEEFERRFPRISIRPDLSKILFDADLFSFTHIHRTQVLVDGKVITVLNDHRLVDGRNDNDADYLASKYGTLVVAIFCSDFDSGIMDDQRFVQRMRLIAISK